MKIFTDKQATTTLPFMFLNDKMFKEWDQCSFQGQ